MKCEKCGYDMDLHVPREYGIFGKGLEYNHVGEHEHEDFICFIKK